MVRKIVVTIIEKSMILAGTYREEGENELLKICLVPRSPSHVYRSRIYVLRWITAFPCFGIPDPPEALPFATLTFGFTHTWLTSRQWLNAKVALDIEGTGPMRDVASLRLNFSQRVNGTV